MRLAAILAAVLAAQLWAQRGKAAPAPAPASAIAVVDREMRQAQGTLDSIKAELERGRARLTQLQSEEGNYLSRIDQLSRNIAVSGQYIDMAHRQIDTTEKIITMLGDSLVRAETDLHNAKELMKRRIRAAYMTRETSWLQMLLTSSSPMEFLYRVRYFQELNRYDKQLAETIQQQIAAVNEKRTVQEAGRERLVRLLNDRRREQQTLAQEEASRRATLEDIRTRREASAAMLAELEEAQRELDALMRILETRRRRAVREDEERRAVTNFEGRRGRLTWPVTGNIINRFGRVVHPVYQTVIMNNGITIAARKGTPVQSVAPGSVAHTGWMRGLGRLVILDHGGGFMTLYAHLDEILVEIDDNVLVGTEVGRVGETGTAGGPRLHFEIRRATQSLNPEEWLMR